MFKRTSTARSLPKDRTVHGIPVKKLPVGKYITSMEDLQELPRIVLERCFPEGTGLRDAFQSDNLMAAFSKLLVVAPELIIDLAVQYLETDKETLLALSPSELLDVLEAWWELNDLTDFFKRVWGKVKPMLERYQTQTPGSSDG